MVVPWVKLTITLVVVLTGYRPFIQNDFENVLKSLREFIDNKWIFDIWEFIFIGQCVEKQYILIKNDDKFLALVSMYYRNPKNLNMSFNINVKNQCPLDEENYNDMLKFMRKKNISDSKKDIQVIFKNTVYNFSKLSFSSANFMSPHNYEFSLNNLNTTNLYSPRHMNTSLNIFYYEDYINNKYTTITTPERSECEENTLVKYTSLDYSDEEFLSDLILDEDYVSIEVIKDLSKCHYQLPWIDECDKECSIVGPMDIERRNYESNSPLCFDEYNNFIHRRRRIIKVENPETDLFKNKANTKLLTTLFNIIQIGTMVFSLFGLLLKLKRYYGFRRNYGTSTIAPICSLKKKCNFILKPKIPKADSEKIARKFKYFVKKLIVRSKSDHVQGTGIRSRDKKSSQPGEDSAIYKLSLSDTCKGLNLAKFSQKRLLMTKMNPKKSLDMTNDVPPMESCLDCVQPVSTTKTEMVPYYSEIKESELVALLELFQKVYFEPTMDIKLLLTVLIKHYSLIRNLLPEQYILWKLLVDKAQKYLAESRITYSMSDGSRKLHLHTGSKDEQTINLDELLIQESLKDISEDELEDAIQNIFSMIYIDNFQKQTLKSHEVESKNKKLNNFEKPKIEVIIEKKISLNTGNNKKNKHQRIELNERNTNSKILKKCDSPGYFITPNASTDNYFIPNYNLFFKTYENTSSQQSINNSKTILNALISLPNLKKTSSSLISCESTSSLSSHVNKSILNFKHHKEIFLNNSAVITADSNTHCCQTIYKENKYILPTPIINIQLFEDHLLKSNQLPSCIAVNVIHLGNSDIELDESLNNTNLYNSMTFLSKQKGLSINSSTSDVNQNNSFLKWRMNSFEESTSNNYFKLNNSSDASIFITINGTSQQRNISDKNLSSDGSVENFDYSSILQKITNVEFQNINTEKQLEIGLQLEPLLNENSPLKRSEVFDSENFAKKKMCTNAVNINKKLFPTPPVIKSMFKKSENQNKAFDLTCSNENLLTFNKSKEQSVHLKTMESPKIETISEVNFVKPIIQPTSLKYKQPQKENDNKHVKSQSDTFSFNLQNVEKENHNIKESDKKKNKKIPAAAKKNVKSKEIYKKSFKSKIPFFKNVSHQKENIHRSNKEASNERIKLENSHKVNKVITNNTNNVKESLEQDSTQNNMPNCKDLNIKNEGKDNARNDVINKLFDSENNSKKIIKIDNKTIKLKNKTSSIKSVNNFLSKLPVKHNDLSVIKKIENKAKLMNSIVEINEEHSCNDFTTQVTEELSEPVQGSQSLKEVSQELDNENDYKNNQEYKKLSNKKITWADEVAKPEMACKIITLYSQIKSNATSVWRKVDTAARIKIKNETVNADLVSHESTDKIINSEIYEYNLLKEIVDLPNEETYSTDNKVHLWKKELILSNAEMICEGPEENIKEGLKNHVNINKINIKKNETNKELMIKKDDSSIKSEGIINFQKKHASKTTSLNKLELNKKSKASKIQIKKDDSIFKTSMKANQEKVAIINPPSVINKLRKKDPFCQEIFCLKNKTSDFSAIKKPTVLKAKSLQIRVSTKSNQ